MIRNFSEIGKNDIEIVGGKGANLGEMTRAGINVPTGFVITSNAYRSFLKENGIDKDIKNLIINSKNDEIELYKAAEKIRNEIERGEYPKQIKDSIEENYKKMCKVYSKNDVRVAVRSSATAEDLPDASFAGQQETYLNVTGIDMLLSKVKDCYASLWGNRAVNYRKNQGYNQESVALAVVVQEMVESEKAGVIFTANPVTNDREEIQINASYGLGEAVVSGKVTPDTYLCSKDGKVKTITLGNKSVEFVYAKEGMIKEKQVDEKRSKTRCLNDEEIKMLCYASTDIENHYKNPMDIEWALRDNKAYILQARAITTLNAKNDEKVIETYMKKNKISGVVRKNMAFVLEKLPVAAYPMDYNFFRAISSSKEKILSEGGIKIAIDPIIDDDGIMVLPPNNKKITKKIFTIGLLIKEFRNLQYCKNKCEESMKYFSEKIEKEIANVNFSSLSLEECATITEKIVETVKSIAYSRFRYALFPEVLLSKKLDKIIKRVDQTLTSFDLCYNLNNKTALVTKDIANLAEIIVNNKTLKEEIISGKSYKSICIDFPEIAQKFEGFMNKNGMKSDFNCYCLYAKSFKEDPDRLLRIIRPLLKNPVSSDENKFDKLMNKIKEVCGEKKFNKVKRNIEYFRYFHVVREESQYLWESLYYYERMAIKRAASLCSGDEDYTNNIAYLFLDEFISMAKSGNMTNEANKKIERRKNKRYLAEEIWLRSKACVFKKSGKVLKGVSGSRGKATGVARIINGPEEFYKLKKGDILICPLTDPEWTPLFKVASAVVSDTGGALSHAAIVAREYNVPAVLGVGNATLKFKDGNKVCVDGSKGEVFLVD